MRYTSLARCSMWGAALAALGVLGFGCKVADGAPTADPAASPPASALRDEDPTAQKKVTKEDCGRWADHGVAVVIDSIHTAAHDCPDAQRANVVAKFDDQRVGIHDGALSFCTKHIDETYLVKDAGCFSRATTAKELMACKFAPMTSAGDTDIAALVDDVRRTCAQRAAQVAGAASASK